MKKVIYLFLFVLVIVSVVAVKDIKFDKKTTKMKPLDVEVVEMTFNPEYEGYPTLVYECEDNPKIGISYTGYVVEGNVWAVIYTYRVDPGNYCFNVDVYDPNSVEDQERIFIDGEIISSGKGNIKVRRSKK